MSQHPEIIAAPFTIWIAPVGTAFPMVDAQPGAPWTLLGANGERNYAGGGVSVRHQRQYAVPPPPAGETGATVTMVESESLQVRLELLDITLEQYSLVMGGSAVTTTPAAVGVAGVKVMGLAMPAGTLPEFAILARGPSAYAEGMASQYEVPRCVEAGSPGLTFRKGIPAGLSIELSALSDPSATSKAARFGRLVAQFADALPQQPFKFAGTGFRWAGDPLTKSGNNYVATDFAVGMPDWEVTEILFGFPAFGCNTAGEVACPNGFTIEGIATKNTTTGLRTPGLINDGTASIVIDPSIPGFEGGDVIKFTPAAPIPAGVTQLFSVAEFIPNGLFPRGRAAGVSVPSIFGGTVLDESSQGSTSSLLPTLSNAAPYGNVNGGAVRPVFMLVRGHSGKESIFMFGDSIGVGVAGASNNRMFTPRHEFGYLSLGLDDNVQSERRTYFNGCVAGWGFLADQTASSHGNTTASARQLALLARARAMNEGLPIADEIICQQGTNSSTGTQAQLRTGYRAAMAIWRNAIGVVDAPAAGVEMIQRTTSTDGYSTVANQNVATTDAYPAGTRWTINADIGGPDGLGDPTAELRADGTFQHSIAPWRLSAADLADDRDRFAVRAFNTTLAAEWNATSASTISLVAAPALGEGLTIYNGADKAEIEILTVTGSGPFTCTYVRDGGAGVFPIGAPVRANWAPGGLHPSPRGHLEYAQSIIDYKIARGWIRANVVPALSAASITGTPEDGQVLTVNYTVTGFPVPSVALQWQRNGTNISGQTAPTITLNEGTMGLVNGDTISCQITATNSQGNDTDEPTIMFSASGEIAAFLALIDASAQSGFFRLRDATSTPTPFSCVDMNGGAALRQTNIAIAPTIDSALGAVFATAARALDRTQTTGAYTITLAMRKDVGNGATDSVFSSNLPTVIIEGDNATALTPTVFVDGVSTANRQTLYTALNDGLEHTVEIRTSSITALQLGRNGLGFLGSIRRVAVIADADFPSNLAAVRAAAVAAVEAV